MEKIKVFSKSESAEFCMVDDWEPANEEDQIFRHSRSSIILNLAPLYGLDGDKEDINYFVMSPNRCYNSESKVKYKAYVDGIEKNLSVTVHSATKSVVAALQEQYGTPNDPVTVSAGFRDHFCHYMNYFEKFYDKDHWLLAFYARIKFMIDYKPGVEEYTKEGLLNDLSRSVVEFLNADGSYSILHACIQNMVNDNYFINQTYRNMDNECLAYDNKHAKILMEISLLFGIGIPILSHYAFKKNYVSVDVNTIFMDYFSMVLEMEVRKYGVNMLNKLYATTESNVDKNKKRNPVLWQMQDIRAINPTTLTMRIVEQILRQLVPKYEFGKSIISFNFNAILSELRFKITDAGYEFKLASVSSSTRDEDNNSAADKFEAHISKVNEALILQTNVNCDTTMSRIERIYGPFNREEIEFYKYELMKDDRPVKNEYQETLISYLFAKEFKDQGAITLINNDQYIELMIVAKKYLLSMGQNQLPYIIGGRVERIVTKTNINKKIRERIEASELWPMVQQKYNNPKIEDSIFRHIAKILSSDFRVIDFYHATSNGMKITPLVEQLSEEFLQFVLMT